MPFSGIFPLGQRGRSGPLAAILRKYAWSLPLIAVLGLVASVFEGIGIGLLIPLIAFLLAADAIPSGVPGPIAALAVTLAGLDRETKIAVLAAGVAGFIIVKGLVQAANNAFIATLVGWIGRDVRNAMAARILELDYPFFLNQDTAFLAHVLSTDAWVVIDSLRLWLVMIPAAVALLVTSAILAWLNLTLFLVAVVGACLIQAVLLLLERRQRRLSAEMTASEVALWNRILVVIRAARVIRVFGQREQERERFAARADRTRRAVLHSQRLIGVVAPVLDGLLAVLLVAILVTGYWAGMPLPATTAFLVLLMRAQPHAQVVSQSRAGIAAVRQGIDQVEWLLTQERSSKQRVSGAACAAIDRPVRFENVTYRYSDGRCALEAATFTIRPGVSTALIGRSGSGKTTIVNLLTRLLEPEAGAIFLGEQPLETIDVEAWRSRIAVAGQDMELVDGTVAENIAYARPEATREEIMEVARTAGATEFIERLPHGFDTEVGEEGVRLSGGQRQRISLARALLRRPDLLILDEAMNAVDAISEAEIMRLLSEHRDFRTALVVSHRKSTLSACSDGIVIEEGCVREAGPLATLAYFREMAGSSPAAEP